MEKEMEKGFDTEIEEIRSVLSEFLDRWEEEYENDDSEIVIHSLYEKLEEVEELIENEYEEKK